METVAAIAACTILAALAVFQFLLILGVPIGHFAWGGQHRVLPTRLRIGSAVAIVLYALFALMILDRAGLTAVLPDAVVAVGIWVLVGYLALGVIMNAISRSKPERYTMTPVTLVLGVLCLLVALG